MCEVWKHSERHHAKHLKCITTVHHLAFSWLLFSSTQRSLQATSQNNACKRKEPGEPYVLIYVRIRNMRSVMWQSAMLLRRLMQLLARGVLINSLLLFASFQIFCNALARVGTFNLRRLHYRVLLMHGHWSNDVNTPDHSEWATYSCIQYSCRNFTHLVLHWCYWFEFLCYFHDYVHDWN